MDGMWNASAAYSQYGLASLYALPHITGCRSSCESKFRHAPNCCLITYEYRSGKGGEWNALFYALPLESLEWGGYRPIQFYLERQHPTLWQVQGLSSDGSLQWRLIHSMTTHSTLLLCMCEMLCAPCNGQWCLSPSEHALLGRVGVHVKKRKPIDKVLCNKDTSTNYWCCCPLQTEGIKRGSTYHAFPQLHIIAGTVVPLPTPEPPCLWMWLCIMIGQYPCHMTSNLSSPHACQTLQSNVAIAWHCNRVLLNEIAHMLCMLVNQLYTC